jgi:Raf kinase inhibitor-like YbhB/YbcL family protein
MLARVLFSAILLSASPVFAQSSPTTPMTLSSPSFEDGGIIADKYSMKNPMPVSPAFNWSNAPVATVSFTLILHDVDSVPRPGFRDNLHWLIFNLPATVTGLAENVPAQPQLPDGSTQGLNGSHKVGYLPLGARFVYHHYVAELYALDTKLSLGSGTTRADVLDAMDGHVIAKSAYEGRFHR